MKKINKSGIGQAIRSYEKAVRLACVSPTGKTWSRLHRAGIALRNRANKAQWCIQANKLWYLATLCSANATFVDAFKKQKLSKFYEAWCELEQAELACEMLMKNQIVKEYVLIAKGLARVIADWQSLYPYKVFFSPEMTVEKSQCSICGLDTGPWSSCPHQARKIYCGMPCYRMIKKVSFKSIAIVLKPVQKYSVARIMNDDGTDQFTYDTIRWVSDRLRRPYDRWGYYKTVRLRSRQEFSDRDPKELCPCDSGRSYRSCCLNLSGVKTPHLQFSFEYEPEEGLSNFTQF